MQTYIPRSLEHETIECLSLFPCTAILGPRQCGKTTLAAAIARTRDSIHLDLERPADRRRLLEPELFFEEHRHRLICLDEIQRSPELFAVLRRWVDRHPESRFLILGPASPELIRQSSESLAGRIAYLELTPFMGREVFAQGVPMKRLWVRGGFPDSLLAATEELSVRWRVNFIQTFLQRDIPALGFRLPAATLERVWTMCAHGHGQPVNASALGSFPGLSHTTIRKYLELLSQTYLIRLL